MQKPKTPLKPGIGWVIVEIWASKCFPIPRHDAYPCAPLFSRRCHAEEFAEKHGYKGSGRVVKVEIREFVK